MGVIGGRPAALVGEPGQAVTPESLEAWLEAVMAPLPPPVRPACDGEGRPCHKASPAMAVACTLSIVGSVSGPSPTWGPTAARRRVPGLLPWMVARSLTGALPTPPSTYGGPCVGRGCCQGCR